MHTNWTALVWRTVCNCGFLFRDHQGWADAKKDEITWGEELGKSHRVVYGHDVPWVSNSHPNGTHAPWINPWTSWGRGLSRALAGHLDKPAHASLLDQWHFGPQDDQARIACTYTEPIQSTRSHQQRLRRIWSPNSKQRTQTLNENCRGERFCAKQFLRNQAAIWKAKWCWAASVSGRRRTEDEASALQSIEKCGKVH